MLSAIARALRGDSAGDVELGAVLDSSFDGIVVMNGTGRILEINRAAQRLFGYQREKSVGHDLLALISAGRDS